MKKQGRHFETFQIPSPFQTPSLLSANILAVNEVPKTHFDILVGRLIQN